MIMNANTEAVRQAQEALLMEHCRAAAESMWLAIRERFQVPVEREEAFVRDMTSNYFRKADQKTRNIILKSDGASERGLVLTRGMACQATIPTGVSHQ
jgi:hypothetical protein